MKAYAAAARRGLAGRELGALPVTVALAAVMAVFSSLNSHFLSPRTSPTSRCRWPRRAPSRSV